MDDLTTIQRVDSMIPPSLAEWKQWAERFQTASLYYPEEFRAVANAMSEETFKELAEFYVKAAREAC
jgi:hypothetical protein